MNPTYVMEMYQWKLPFFPARPVAQRCIVDLSGILIGNIRAAFIYGANNNQYKDHPVGQQTQTDLLTLECKVIHGIHGRCFGKCWWCSFSTKERRKRKKLTFPTNYEKFECCAQVDFVTHGEGTTKAFQPKKIKLSKHTGQRENWTKDKLLLENLVMSHLPSRNCPSGALMCRMLVGI